MHPILHEIRGQRYIIIHDSRWTDSSFSEEMTRKFWPLLQLKNCSVRKRMKFYRFGGFTIYLAQESLQQISFVIVVLFGSI